jgi:hypothetical protein
MNFREHFIFTNALSNARVSARRGWGISPSSNDSRGDIPLQLEFFWKFFSGFGNFNNFKCKFKAFRSIINHSKVLKTHQGAISTLKK